MKGEIGQDDGQLYKIGKIMHASNIVCYFCIYRFKDIFLLMKSPCEKPQIELYNNNVQITNFPMYFQSTLDFSRSCCRRIFIVTVLV